MTPQEKLAALCVRATRDTVLKKLIFSKPADKTVLRAAGRLCLVGDRTMLQIETLHKDNKATHENLAPDADMAEKLGERIAGFSQVNLITTVGECELRVGKRGNAVLLGGDKLSLALDGSKADTVAVAGNNKEKQYILQGKEPFLKLLGVSDDKGRVFDKKGAKFRQINRFLELVRDTLPHLPKERIHIADLCCGKSYLSFAVYHYFANVLGLEVEMTGVDLKPDVITYCNKVAGELGFTGLHFVCGDVAAFVAKTSPELVVSLHACDTATDLVLQKAMEWQARVILSTPCCHHELNHTLACPTLDFIGQHSMLRQKLCDAATDALRLKLLEANGYRTAALELIDPDDTPKNIMLRAIRRNVDAKTDATCQRAAAEYAAARHFLLGE